MKVYFKSFKNNLFFSFLPLFLLVIFSQNTRDHLSGCIFARVSFYPIILTVKRV